MLWLVEQRNVVQQRSQVPKRQVLRSQQKRVRSVNYGGIIMIQSMNDEELKWQRRSDARTLAEAERIKADKERYQGAIIGAKEIAKEEIDRVKGIAKIAGMKTPKSPKQDCNSSDNTTLGRGNYRNPATIGRL